MIKADWSRVAVIYKQGIESGDATFEVGVPTWEEWDRNHLNTCRIVALNGQELIGWAALSPVSGRCVYGGVGEVSVYVSTSHQGLKVGSLLLKTLIDESEKQDIWTLQAGIFRENTASLKMHARLGFRQIGYREKIGKMKGVWRDTVLFERRSKIVGMK